MTADGEFFLTVTPRQSPSTLPRALSLSKRRGDYRGSGELRIADFGLRNGEGRKPKTGNRKAETARGKAVGVNRPYLGARACSSGNILSVGTCAISVRAS